MHVGNLTRIIMHMYSYLEFTIDPAPSRRGIPDAVLDTVTDAHQNDLDIGPGAETALSLGVQQWAHIWR